MDGALFLVCLPEACLSLIITQNPQLSRLGQPACVQRRSSWKAETRQQHFLLCEERWRWAIDDCMYHISNEYQLFLTFLHVLQCKKKAQTELLTSPVPLLLTNVIPCNNIIQYLPVIVLCENKSFFFIKTCFIVLPPGTLLNFLASVGDCRHLLDKDCHYSPLC